MITPEHDRLEDHAEVLLVRLARAGRSEAMGELVRRFLPLACSIARRYADDPQTAQELAQEAMLEAYLALATLRDDTRFRSWLYGLVLNVCRSYVRGRRAVFFSLDSLAGGSRSAGDADLDPAALAEQLELRRMLRQAVAGLSEPNRAAVRLFYYEGLSLPQIADSLGISVAAVKGRLHKSRLQLRETLRPLFPERIGPRSDGYGSLKFKTKVKGLNQMVKVSVFDVVPQDQPQSAASLAVILLDEAGGRMLPIWVGQYEGEAIAAGLRDLATARPLTYNFVQKLLEASGARLEEVRIAALRESTFYAVVRLATGDGQTHEIDARPSDALALAVRTGAPVFAAPEVMDEHSLPLPAEQAGRTPQARGVEGIAAELTRRQQDWSVKTTMPFDLQQHQARQQKLLNYLFEA